MEGSVLWEAGPAPGSRSRDGFVPALAKIMGLRAGHARFEALVIPGKIGDCGDVFPDPSGEAGEECCAESGGFGDGGANYGDSENVGLELHERVVGGRAAIDAEFGERGAGVGLDGVG